MMKKDKSIFISYYYIYYFKFILFFYLIFFNIFQMNNLLYLYNIYIYFEEKKISNIYNIDKLIFFLSFQNQFQNF